MKHLYSAPARAARTGWLVALVLGLPALPALAQTPTITSLSPASGAPGSTVTVNGTNLSSTRSVRFGELPATFSITSSTQLTVTVPRAASTHRLRVTRPSGTALSTAAFGVTKAGGYGFSLVASQFNSINGGSYSAPFCTDLDGDGLVDLIMGKDDGTLSHYEQAGANSTSFTLVTASFNSISVGNRSAPTFTDLDGDGRLDMLVGESDGSLNHYEQAAAGSTTFALVTTSFNGIDVGDHSKPTFTDLDGDGLLDMLVGANSGYLSHYEQAAVNSTSFTLATTNFIGSSLGLVPSPTFVDLDGDGLLDLLVGDFSTSLKHYEQTAAGSTSFALITAKFGNLNVSTGATPAFTDLDGDGLLDLLAGNFFGSIGHYEQGLQPVVTGFSPASGAPGSTVTVTGTQLAGTTSVRFGERPAGFSVLSATQLRVTVPRAASTHKLRVNAPGGAALSATAFGVTKANSYSFPLVATRFRNVDVYDWSAPALTDLDGDGLLDLLVGRGNGTMIHYEQEEANSSNFTWVEQEFSGINVGGFSVPTFTDLDGDGLLDLLVGERDGNLNHYEQAAAGSTSFTLVNANFSGINVGTFAAPTFTDLDGDGLLDLLVGEDDGNVNHYEQAADNSATFHQVTNFFNGIDPGNASGPALADLDGDGLLDLLVGEANGILHHYEQAAAHSTTFSAVSSNFSSIIVAGRSSGPAIMDIDGDGLLDLLIGTAVSHVSHYEQAPPAPPTLTGFSPASGPQGSTVTIAGTNFTYATSVRFGEQPAAFSVASATQLTVTVPRGASSHKLRVTTPAGTALSGAAFGVTKPGGLGFPLVTATFSNLSLGVAGAPVPAFVDLDGDGLLDLLVGKDDGTLSRYEQTAANATAFALVTASLSSIDAGTYAAPALTDLDGDGLLDMLVGETDGNLNHYEQAAVNGSGFVLVAASFNSIDVGSYSKPTLADLDGDGLTDLLVGKDDGTLSHYEQQAANSTSFTLVTASFNGIDVGSLSAPALTDLDGDGLLDLLVGEANGTLHHYKQTAANAPAFALATASFNGIAVGWSSAPALTDLDGDGLLDLLVGENFGTLHHYEQAPPPTITSFSPASGAQGSTVTVNGTHLSSTKSVRFGELPAVFSALSATQLAVTVPRGASTHKLRLTTLSGTALSATAFGVDKSGVYRFPLVTASFNGLDVGRGASPAFADLDGDGLLDMLMGETDGNLNHYEQQAAGSTTLNPVTSSFNGIAVGTYAAPAFTDLDGDGLLDLLVGAGDGTLHHYEQQAANSTTFSLVTASFNGIDVDAASVPAFTDLDGDGLLDLLVGESDGNLNHYEQALANSTSFPLVTASFNGLDVGAASAPVFIDLDGDGLLDLLVGESSGNLNHYEQATAGSLSFALVTASFNGLDVGADSRPALTDLDGDGLLDLLVGEFDGNLNHYEQAPAPIILSFSPASGAQGSTVTVTGAHFTGTTSVRFGEQPAAFSITSDTELSVLVPRGASTHKLRATTPDGTALSATAFGVDKVNSTLFPLVSSSFNGRDVGFLATPALADLDGDGLLDLLVGEFDGTLNHYEQATAGSTAFDVVTNSFNSIDVGIGSAPAFTDLDGNGRLDLLVGKQDGTLSHYEQTAAGSSSFTLVTASFNTIDVGDYAAPAFTDLDGDGLLDLLVGEADGTLNHYEQAAAVSATFPLVTNSFNGRDVGSNSAPVFADLDGDGLLDLLVGEQDGNLNHFEQFAAHSATFGLATESFNGIEVGDNSTPAFTDLDGDGLLDMLVGKQDGTTAHYEQALPPTVTSFSPASGAQGSTVTVTGTSLSYTSSVRFGELPAVFSVLSATQLAVTVPRGASTHKLHVATPAGTALSAGAFAVDKANSYVFAAVTANFNTINVGQGAAPAFADLDGDGLLDMLVGERDGNMNHYEQQAANSTSFALVAANFNSIAVGTYAVPAFTDLDGDGLLDLLVGEGDGNLNHYEQTAANATSFALVTDSFSLIDVGVYAAPALTDLDGDGLLDLLVGEGSGNLNHYEQTGANAGSFALVSASFNGLDIGAASVPVFVDLDGDGLLDMLVGEADGNLNHYEQAAAGSTTFALVTDSFNGIDVGIEARPAFTDLDGDGLLDLLVGEADGNLNHYEQVMPAPTLTALSSTAELPGMSVVLTGTGFTSASTVTFGGVAASSVGYTSPTSLTAVVPVGAAAGVAAVAVTTPGGTAALPAGAFEVLQVYRGTGASGCLSTAAVTLSGSGGSGAWRYLRLPGAGGAVVAAVEDTRNLGTVTAGFQALGTATSTAVRRDGGYYLDRNFYLTATSPTFTGQSVRVRFFGLSSELARLQAADAGATLAGLNASQYSGAGEDCELGNNSPTGERRLLAAPATVVPGADWFTAECNVTDHFSEFYLTGASRPLPVQLVAFTAERRGADAVLRWTTAQELRNDRFEVEASADGQQYRRIGTVAGQGTTSTRHDYQFTDAGVPKHGSSVVYYRLRQVDTDGTAQLSAVRAVQASTDELPLRVWPNPTRETVQVSGVAPGQPVQLRDAVGRVVATGAMPATGVLTLPLPAQLPAGIYTVQAQGRSTRLVVQ